MSDDDPSPIRAVLIDDHAMVRQALASVLEDEPSIEVVAQGDDAPQAIRIVRELLPDVLVLDYNLPGGGALPVIEEITRHHLAVRVLVLTVHDSPHYAVRVLEAGAHGFVIKSAAVEELLDAIRAVHAGDIYITKRIARPVIDHLRRPRKDRVGLASLSAREFELLRALGAGMGLKETAHRLKISVSTASTYRARIMKKLNLASTSELIRFALENEI